MSTHAPSPAKPVKQSRFMRRALPYFLSLPALLICIGILIPFFTAVYYSMLRYRMNLPAMKGFIWFDNYINFFTDPKTGQRTQIQAGQPGACSGYGCIGSGQQNFPRQMQLSLKVLF